MPSNLTAEDFKAIEEHLRKEYIFVGRQTVVVALAFLAALGVGTVVSAYNAAKSVASTEAERIAKEEAKKVVPDTVSTLVQELNGLKVSANDAVKSIESCKGRVEDIEKGLSKTDLSVLNKNLSDSNGNLNKLIKDIGKFPSDYSRITFPLIHSLGPVDGNNNPDGRVQIRVAEDGSHITVDTKFGITCTDRSGGKIYWTANITKQN